MAGRPLYCDFTWYLEAVMNELAANAGPVVSFGVMGIVLIVAALFFKSLLFLYMTFLYQSGRLFFYLIRMRKTYENVEAEFETFSRLLNK